MVTLTVSFNPNGSNAEVIAEVVKLLAGLDPHLPTATNEKVADSSLVAKPVKTRKIRVMTDEQKAAFRARMIAGREAKESAKTGKPVKVEAKPVEKSAKPKAKLAKSSRK